MSENTLVDFLKTITSDKLDSYIIDLVNLGLNEEEIVHKLLQRLSEGEKK